MQPWTAKKSNGPPIYQDVAYFAKDNDNTNLEIWRKSGQRFGEYSINALKPDSKSNHLGNLGVNFHQKV